MNPRMKWGRAAVTLVFSLLLSVGFYIGRVVASGNTRYWFLLWNLFLGSLPLVFAAWLGQWLRYRRWLSWQGILLTLLWLGFLPNSFYLISDLIHIHETGEVSILYDVVVFISFIWNGYLVGYTSLYLMHTRLLKKLHPFDAHALIAAVLLLCSFAIYLGRSLHWNTWDVLLNPAGILFDVSDRIINPAAHPQTFTTTLMFFVLLGGIYTVIWQLVKSIRTSDEM